MTASSGRIVLLLAAISGLAGCAPIAPQGKSPLMPARMTPQSVALDVFFIRCPLDDQRANDTLWGEVDEQHFPDELRWRLTRNGLRVGLVGSQIPASLWDLLELEDNSPPAGQAHQGNLVGLDIRPRVVPRHIQTGPGRRNEIVTSGVYDELPVLLRESNRLGGQTYRKAQGLLSLRVFNQRDSRVRLELTPELYYGETRQHWVGNEHTLRLDAGRSKRVFEELAISATLSPGQMLVIGSLHDRPGSLGHYFLTTDECGQLEQKLLVVRLAQTQHNDLLLPQAIIPLDD